jgi:hypothetical protein
VTSYISYFESVHVKKSVTVKGYMIGGRRGKQKVKGKGKEKRRERETH